MKRPAFLFGLAFLLSPPKVTFGGPAVSMDPPPTTAGDDGKTLDLAEVIRQAQVRPIDVVVAHQRVAQALDQIAQARASLLPQASLSGSQSRQTRNLESQGIALPGRDPLVGPFNSFDARARLSLALFDKAAWDRLEAARAGQRLSLAEQQKTRQDSALLAAGFYLQARRTRTLKTLADALQRRDSEDLRVARAQQANGTGNELAVSQAEAAAADSQARLKAAEADDLSARMDLASTLGYGPSDSLELVPEEPLTAPPPADITHDWIETQDEVVLARQALESRKAEAAATQADHWPKLSASADYGFSGKTPAENERTYSYGAQASLPVFEGGRTRARARESTKAVEIAEARLADTRRRVEADARSAREAMEKSWLALSARQEALPSARRALEISRTRQTSGSGSALEVTRQEAFLAQAMDTVEEAAARYQTARLQWQRALGRLP